MRKGNLSFFLRNNEIGIKFLVLINAWRFQSTFCLGRNKLCSYIKTAEVGKLFHDDEIKWRERGKKKTKYLMGIFRLFVATSYELYLNVILLYTVY